MTVRSTWLLCLAFAVLPLPSEAAVQMGDPAISRLESRAPEKRGRQTVQQIRLDRAAIEASAASGRLHLPSTSGKPLVARDIHQQRRPDGLTTWVGKVDTRFGEQSVVLTLGDGVSFGLLPQFDGPALRVETRHGKTWLVEGPDSDQPLPQLADDGKRPPPGGAASRKRRAEQDALAADTPPQVDVLVLYTPALLSIWGSTEAMLARVAQLEAISNQAYVDSDAGLRIRVVGVHLVNHTAQDDNDVVLDALSSGSGSLPLRSEALRLRSMYGADFVALLRPFERANQTSCGYAWIGGYHGDAFTEDRGYSVTADHGLGGDNCPEWTFTHELGHNMGGGHDLETADGDYGAFLYSRGHRQTVDPSSGFATVMAYRQAPQVVIGRFSNPRQTQCLGQPCGDAVDADNARGFTQAGSALAALVPAIVADGRPTVSVGDLVVDEGDAGQHPARFILTLSAPSASPVVLGLATMQASAIGADFVGSTASVTIPAGQTAVSFDVAVRGDNQVELDEAFALNITSANGARIADGQGVAIVRNDEPIPGISIGDVTAEEGNSGVTRATFTASLSQASNTPVTFSADTSTYVPGPTSATSDIDFDALAIDNLQIPAGATQAQFTVDLRGDTEVEQDERFVVRLSNITAAIVIDNRSNALIVNDDGLGPRPRLSIAPAELTEGNAGTSPLVFTVTLSAPSGSPVRFGLATRDATAVAGSDYAARLETDRVIAPGETTAVFSVPISGDTSVEADEAFLVELNNVVGADIGTSQASGTIRNDDGGSLTVLATRDDRVVLRENSAPVSIDVRANDVVDPAKLAGGSLVITDAPAHGSASVLANGTPGTVADDLLRYAPPANFSGDDVFGYRLCEAGGRCVDGLVAVVLRPSLDVALPSPAATGRHDLSMTGLRALPAAGFIATPLIRGTTSDQALGADPSPETPWDANRAGTHVTTDVVTYDAQRPEWRVLVDASSANGDVDVYLGLDDDDDGQPDPAEVRCTAAMSTVAERCEMAIRLPPEPYFKRYWVMLHNRSPAQNLVRMHRYGVGLVDGTGTFEGEVAGTMAVTGPGHLPAAAGFPLRLAWRLDSNVAVGQRLLSYVRLRSDAGTEAGLFPVLIERTGNELRAESIDRFETAGLQLAPGQAHDLLFVDVPAGATAMQVITRGTPSMSLYLSRRAASGASRIEAAPPREDAVVVLHGLGGQQISWVDGAQLAPGRWYVTIVNNGPETAAVSAETRMFGQAPAVRPGSYFNAARSGHGLFLYPAGNDWAGLWYTYLQDGSPTWYYLQGAKPGEDGRWNGTIYRSAWSGTSARLTAVGTAMVTATAPDAFLYTYTLDQETGSEPMTALGRGCPSLAGLPVDASSHWFDPARAGTGYSVQLFPNYEFLAAFVYDGHGVPRFLTAERNGFGGADATLTLEQLAGFCPLCDRVANPARADIGTLRRRFVGGSLSRITVQGSFQRGLPGTWSADDAVQVLGGAGTTQGCTMP